MRIPLLVIVGPTAVGKTKVAIKVAQRLKAEIISADSRQVYRLMDIGTATPGLDERKGVPHHLLSIVNPDENFSVVDFQKLAQNLIVDIWKRGRLPMLVGGTGLYVQAVVDNYNFSTVPTNYDLRQRFLKMAQDRGGEYLLSRLRDVDPVTAEKLHPNDVRRIVRGLEVFYESRRPLSAWKNLQDRESPYRLCMVGLTMERKHLYKNIEQRVLRMVEHGLVGEVRGLLDRGYGAGLNAMQGLGYKELLPYLAGQITLPEAIATLQRDTRRFAKRQLTWFRRDPRIEWFTIGESPLSKVVEEISKLAAGKLR